MWTISVTDWSPYVSMGDGTMWIKMGMGSLLEWGEDSFVLGYISLMMSPEDSEDEIELNISKSALKITGSWKEASSGRKKTIKSLK